jgi:hypothetical protein
MAETDKVELIKKATRKENEIKLLGEKSKAFPSPSPMPY